MGRRGHGEGTISKHATRDLWVARLRVSGERITAYAKSKREAVLKLAELRRRRDQGALAGTERQSVAAFLADWLEHTAKPTIRPHTYAAYRVYVHRHLIPSLGKHQLAKLTPQHVQAFLAERLAAGYAPKTVRDARAVLRRGLGHAVKWGIVARNVAALVDPPKSERYRGSVLDLAGIRALLDAVKGDRLEALVTLAIYCGLREGELLALRWPDVDLAAGTLAVRGTLQRVGGRLVVAEPKTERGRRTVTLPEPVAEALREHRVRQLAERVKAADVWRDHGLVFPSEVGTPMDPRNLIRRWHRVRAKLGRPELRFHDLRHSCATLWLAAGEHTKLVGELLGHHSITMTADLYGHLAPAAHRDAAARIGRLIGGSG